MLDGFSGLQPKPYHLILRTRRAAWPATWQEAAMEEHIRRAAPAREESTAGRRASVHSGQGTAEPQQRPSCLARRTDNKLQNTRCLTGIQHGRSQPEEQQRPSEPCQEHQPEGSGSCERKSIRPFLRANGFDYDQFYTSDAGRPDSFREFFPHMMAPADLLRQRKELRNRAPQEQASRTCKSSAKTSRMLRETAEHSRRAGARPRSDSGALQRVGLQAWHRNQPSRHC